MQTITQIFYKSKDKILVGGIVSQSDCEILCLLPEGELLRLELKKGIEYPYNLRILGVNGSSKFQLKTVVWGKPAIYGRPVCEDKKEND